MFEVILFRHEEDAIPIRLMIEAESEDDAKARALEDYPKGIFVQANRYPNIMIFQ